MWRGRPVSPMGAESQRSAQTVLPKSGFTWWSCGHCSFHRQIDVIALISPVANTTLSLAYPGQALSQYSALSCCFPTAFWVAKGEIWGFFLQLEDVARAQQAWQHRHVFGHSWGHTVCTGGISETWHGVVWPQAGQAGLCFPSALWRAAGTAAPPNASGSTKSAGPARRDVSPGHGQLQAGSVPGMASLPPPSLGDLTRGLYLFFPNAHADETIIDLGWRT